VSYWLGEIPLHQTALLLYINERTLRYGKDKEHISRAHFLDGIRDRHGALLHNGLSIKKSSLWVYLAEIETAGLVFITHLPRTPRGNLYELNVMKILDPILGDKLQTSSFSRMRGRRRRRISVDAT